jgi:hypothetical protein
VLRKRFGWPQVFASLLLGAFLLQSLWVVHRTPLRWAEAAYAQAGLDQLAGKTLPRDSGVLPAPAAVAAAPIIVARWFLPQLPPESLKWLLRLPFVAIGWLLGASIWYVARRLYGNAGGYTALTLYCFSPAVLLPWPGPVAIGSLGTFGMIFVAIAAAHTLYAPAGPATWELRSRWRRIVLLGVAIALGAGSGFWAVSLTVLAVGFMLYLVPKRWLASLGLVLSSCVVAFLLLLASFGFRPRSLASVVVQAQLPRFQRGAVASELLRPYATGMRSLESAVLLALTAIAVVAYLVWRRCRYFGNTAPLLVVLVLSGLGAFVDVFIGPFPQRASPFLYVFIGGVFADLLEGHSRNTFRLLLLGLLAAYAAAAVVKVVQMPATALY